MKKILGDTKGFAWDLVLTAPDGESESIKGFSNDISQSIDPDTGQIIGARTVTVAIAPDDLTIGRPKSIPDKASKPWTVSFDDLSSVQSTFKVTTTYPDQTLGLLVCVLENYTPA